MKALFLGLGSIGQRHLRNFISLVPDSQVLAVRISRSAPLLSNENQVVEGGSIAQAYSILELPSLQEALEEKPELVFITNPTILHYDSVISSLNFDTKIFIEKPVSHDLTSAKELADREFKLGTKKCMVGYQFRFHPALKIIKRILQEKRIGSIVNVSLVNGEYMPGWHPYEDYRQSYAARKELGGGALLTQIHDFDYATWLFGLPTRLFAIGGKLSKLEIDVEDSVQLLLESNPDFQESRFPISVTLDYLRSPPKRSISIIGDEGCIDCDLVQNSVSITYVGRKETDVYNFPDFNRNMLFVDQMKCFLSFALNNSLPSVDIDSALASMRIAEGAKLSLENKQVIDLENL